MVKEVEAEIARLKQEKNDMEATIQEQYTEIVRLSSMENVRLSNLNLGGDRQVQNEQSVTEDERLQIQDLQNEVAKLRDEID